MAECRFMMGVANPLVIYSCYVSVVLPHNTWIEQKGVVGLPWQSFFC